MDQSCAPLWEAIVEYANKSVIPFHTPGHKLRSGVFPHIDKILGTSLWALDASDEVEDITNNHSFKQVLKLAETLAGELFNSYAARFLINGTSGGIHSMLLGLTGKIVIPRFSHQSVYGGLILSEAEPIYLAAKIDSEWNIPLPPTFEEIKQVLEHGKNIETIFLTYPTYYGTTTELEKILKLKKQHEVAIFVDEAHGSHFRFSPELPESAVDLKADLVVHSTHKTLGTLTQSSLLHINNPDLEAKIDTALTVLQSTSPSLILLGVIDAVRRELALSGKALVENAVRLGNYIRDRLKCIDGVKVAPSRITNDPTKILFNLNEIGLSGLEVETRLRYDYNIQVELSDYYNVLALITIGDTEQSVESFLAAVDDLVRRFSGNKPLPKLSVPYYLAIPQKVFSMRRAICNQSEMTALSQAENRIAADFLIPYPPGVPVIVPGEVISSDLIDYLKSCYKNGWEVRGMREENLMVIKEH